MVAKVVSAWLFSSSTFRIVVIISTVAFSEVGRREKARGSVVSDRFIAISDIWCLELFVRDSFFDAYTCWASDYNHQYEHSNKQTVIVTVTVIYLPRLYYCILHACNALMISKMIRHCKSGMGVITRIAYYKYMQLHCL